MGGVTFGRVGMPRFVSVHASSTLRAVLLFPKPLQYKDFDRVYPQDQQPRTANLQECDQC